LGKTCQGNVKAALLHAAGSKALAEMIFERMSAQQGSLRRVICRAAAAGTMATVERHHVPGRHPGHDREQSENQRMLGLWDQHAKNNNVIDHSESSLCGKAG
jgi:hypothetical protein